MPDFGTTEPGEVAFGAVAVDAVQTVSLPVVNVMNLESGLPSVP
jgi:hypothetical protein